MTDDTFERDIAAMLAARDPGGAPAYLESVVRDRIGRDRASRTFARMLRPAGQAGSLLALVALVALAIILVQSPPRGPGATPEPSAGPAYVLSAGDGLARAEDIPLFQIGGWLIAMILLGRLLLVARNRLVTIGATLAVVALVWVATNIGSSDALAYDGGVIGAFPPSARQPDDSSIYVGVTGDQPFHVFLTLQNTSRLPVEVRGLAAPPEEQFDNEVTWPRFVAIGALPPNDMTLAAIEPFHPITIGPGDSRYFLLLGMAGTCALAEPPPGASESGSTGLDVVAITYEQLTIVHTQNVELYSPIRIWWPESCP